ncbi:MAG TPA: FtsX-like permease family protein [Anaerolineae bacterium]
MSRVRLRWLKVWRDLWSNKTRTILVILSITVGVATVGMVMGSQIIVNRDLPDAYAAVNPASATIFAISTFDEAMVEAIEDMPEVAEAEGRRFVSIRFQSKSGEWRNMQLFAIADYEAIEINKVAPESGAWPPPEQTLLIERASFTPALGLAEFEVGDTLIIEPPDGKQRQIQISGTAHDLSQLPAFINGAGYGYINYDTLEWLGEPRDFNQLLFVVEENRLDYDHVKAVGNLVQDRLERSGVAVIFTLAFPPGEHPAQNFLDVLSYVLGAMGLLSLLLSGFLIINTLAAIMTQQVRQIGIMKAIGARTPQITAMYLAMVLLFGALALIIAVPLAALGARGLAGLFAGLLNFDIGGFALEPQVVLVQAVIALSAPVLAAVFPIRRGVGVTVREAISEQGLGKGQFGTHLIDHFIVGLRRIIPMERPAQISLRNTFRRKTRLALTLITLSLASAIFIAIFSVRASLQQTLDDALHYFDYDVLVQFSRPYRVERIQRAAEGVPGIEAVETWGFANARRVRPDGSESDSIIVYAPTADSTMLNPVIIEGRWLRPDDTNAVVVNTDILRNDSDIEVGETITLKMEGSEEVWVVVGIVRGVLTGPNAFVNYDYYGRVVNAVDRGQLAIVATTREDANFQTEVGRALEEHYRDSGFRVEVMQTIAQVRSIITSIFNFIVLFLLFMAVLLGIVGGLGLMGTMSINVIERTREIGVMRAIGASDGAVLRIILLEGVVIGLLSWLIGGLVAIPASRLLAEAVGYTLLQASPSYVFSSGGAIMWLVIVLLLAALASFLPARSASRLTVWEVLSYE